MSQVATPELQQWIVEQARAGCKPEAVLAAMTHAGWKEDVAIEAMEAALGEHMPGLPRAKAAAANASFQGAAQNTSDARSAATPAKPLPEPHVVGHPRQVDAGDRVVDILVSLQSPRVVVFGNLLSAEECEALIADAEPRLKRSLTVETQTGGEALNEARTSDGMFFRRGETPVVSCIEARIARLLNWPLEFCEGLQVLH